MRYDRGLLALSLLYLMVTAFVPFPTSVISETSNRTATIFYALTIALGELMLATLWWYPSWHNRLTDPRPGAQQARRGFVPMLLTVGLVVLSIGPPFSTRAWPGSRGCPWCLSRASGIEEDELPKDGSRLAANCLQCKGGS